MKQKERTATETSDTTETSKNKETFDEILCMLEEQKHSGMIESIIMKENVYHFLIAHFCCHNTEMSVLGIDTTFNLCNIWITDSCYKNDQLVYNPVFWGPLLFQFTKDESISTRFALEMIALDPEITSIKKIGSDMEKAIYNGVKAIIPDSSQLYCVQHISQHDEKKLDILLNK